MLAVTVQFKNLNKELDKLSRGIDQAATQGLRSAINTVAASREASKLGKSIAGALSVPIEKMFDDLQVTLMMGVAAIVDAIKELGKNFDVAAANVSKFANEASRAKKEMQGLDKAAKEAKESTEEWVYAYRGLRDILPKINLSLGGLKDFFEKAKKKDVEAAVERLQKRFKDIKTELKDGRVIFKGLVDKEATRFQRVLARISLTWEQFIINRRWGIRRFAGLFRRTMGGALKVGKWAGGKLKSIFGGILDTIKRFSPVALAYGIYTTIKQLVEDLTNLYKDLTKTAVLSAGKVGGSAEQIARRWISMSVEIAKNNPMLEIEDLNAIFQQLAEEGLDPMDKRIKKLIPSIGKFAMVTGAGAEEITQHVVAMIKAGRGYEETEKTLGIAVQRFGRRADEFLGKTRELFAVLGPKLGVSMDQFATQIGRVYDTLRSVISEEGAFEIINKILDPDLYGTVSQELAPFFSEIREFRRTGDVSGLINAFSRLASIAEKSGDEINQLAGQLGLSAEQLRQLAEGVRSGKFLQAFKSARKTAMSIDEIVEQMYDNPILAAENFINWIRYSLLSGLIKFFDRFKDQFKAIGQSLEKLMKSDAVADAFASFLSLIADGIKDFINKVIEVLGDEEKRQKLWDSIKSIIGVVGAVATWVFNLGKAIVKFVEKYPTLFKFLGGAAATVATGAAGVGGAVGSGVGAVIGTLVAGPAGIGIGATIGNIAGTALTAVGGGLAAAFLGGGEAEPKTRKPDQMELYERVIAAKKRIKELAGGNKRYERWLVEQVKSGNVTMVELLNESNRLLAEFKKSVEKESRANRQQKNLNRNKDKTQENAVSKVLPCFYYGGR